LYVSPNISGGSEENMMGGTCRRRAGVVKCLKLRGKKSEECEVKRLFV